MDEELNLELPSSDEIENLLNEANASLSQDEGTPTDVSVESKQTQQPSTEGQENRPGALGFVQDVAEGTIKDLPQN